MLKINKYYCIERQKQQYYRFLLYVLLHGNNRTTMLSINKIT